MTAKHPLSPRFLLQRYLLTGYAAFIIYVSLSPLRGWHEQGLYFSDVLIAPLAQTFTWFDFILNFLSYFPLGLLLTYWLRKQLSTMQLLLLTTLTGLALSTLMEYAQLYLPARVSSNSDLLSNTLGTLAGSAFALKIMQYSWFIRISAWHDKCFKRGRLSDFGLALVALWAFAQTNPTLPMLGSVFVSEVARWPYDIVPASPFNWLESTEVALNLLLLGILLFTLLREIRYTFNALLLVLFCVILIKFVAAVMLLKSWALLLWLNSEAMLGMLAGLLLLAVVKRFRHSRILASGVLASIAYLLLIFDLFINSQPSAAMRIYHWHYIHMLNYNGFSQIAILLFPVLLLSYLLRAALRK
jgi:VanZ family protein